MSVYDGYSRSRDVDQSGPKDTLEVRLEYEGL
jgi:hypothetical protein